MSKIETPTAEVFCPVRSVCVLEKSVMEKLVETITFIVLPVRDKVGLAKIMFDVKCL